MTSVASRDGQEVNGSADRSTWCLVAATCSAAGAVLWTYLCAFPHSPWNDVRLAPVFMADAGVPVYLTGGAGTLSTWMYGPVPLWLWWPATLAHDAASAVMTAGVLNMGYTLVASAVVCWGWPVAGASRPNRALAFAACVAIWPYSAFGFLQADNLAIACALIANTALMRWTDTTRPRHWAIAFAMALALGSKQTSLGMLAAQCAWLWSERGRSHAFHHLFRTIAACSSLAGIAIQQFGLSALWFGMIEVPAALPWTTQPGQRLWYLLPHLSAQLGLPLLILIFSFRATMQRGHPLRLPFFAWFASIPLGVAAMMTAGGNLNSFQGYCLFLPAFLTVACAAAARRRWWFIAFACAVLLVFGARWHQDTDSHFKPQTVALEQAAQICRLHPGQIWFPWNPLVTYFADKKFYHTEDGLYVRKLTKIPFTREQLEAGLPANLKYVALSSPSWGIALSLTSGGKFEQHLGYWELWRWKQR